MYNKGYEEIVAQHAALRLREQEILKSIRYKDDYRKRVSAYIKALSQHEGLISKLSDKLWNALVDHATVYGKDDIRFTFRDGTELVDISLFCL